MNKLKSSRSHSLLLCLAISLLYINTVVADDQQKTIRVGVLKSGSVHWEVDTLLRQQLDENNDIELKPVIMGSINALLLALQGGAVDMIVGDWIWVARQYQQDRQFQFFPFSSSSGGLLVPPDNSIKVLTDLQDKKLGVAGGSEGKSWLLFKAYARQQHNMNLSEVATVKFVAPPMVNALIQQQQIDAGLNFWHMNAALNVKGYQTVLTVNDILLALGITTKVPMIGWIFHTQWATQNSDLVNRFLRASYQAKQLLADSDQPWLDLKTLMRSDSDAVFDKLKSGFRDGIPAQFGEDEVKAMSQVMDILRAQGAKGLPESLPQELFWRSFDLQSGDLRSSYN